MSANPLKLSNFLESCHTTNHKPRSRQNPLVAKRRSAVGGNSCHVATPVKSALRPGLPRCAVHPAQCLDTHR